MARVALLMAVLLGLLLPGSDALAFGDVPKVNQTRWVSSSGGASYSSCIAGCQAAIHNGPGFYGGGATASGHNCSPISADSSQCYAHMTDTSAAGVVITESDVMGPVFTKVTEVACPPLSREVPDATTNGGTKCTCNAGYEAQGGNCVQNTACPTMASALNALNNPIQVTGAGPGQLNGCYHGCNMQADFGGQGSNGSWWLFGPFKSSGSCETGTASGGDANPAPLPCARGLCPGTVNGSNVCVACGNPTAAGPDGTASAPGGGASAPGGDVPTTTQTTCNGTSCTTTTKDANGTVISVKVEPQPDFCVAHPTSIMCKTSTIGGSCDAVSCDGDAIQCAIAKEQARRNCQLFDIEANDGKVTAGNDAMNGQNQPGDHPGAHAETHDMTGSIDTSDAIGGSGGCPSDESFSYGGTTLTIPWSRTCAGLTLAGQLGVACCLIAAAFIVFRN